MSKPRYGISIPVYGNCGVMNHPLEPRDASYSRAKDLLQLAERCGFTTTLIAEHIINILNGSVETVGDRRVGQFHIELERAKVTQALKYLHESEFEVEVD